MGSETRKAAQGWSGASRLGFVRLLRGHTSAKQGTKLIVDDNPHTEPGQPPALAWGGRAILPGLAVGHAVFHWITQSLVVLLPEVQQAFLLSGVGVGGIMAAREVATGLVKLPAGILVDVLRRFWRALLVICLAGAAGGTILIGSSWAYVMVLLGLSVLALCHSVWHLPASAALSHHQRKQRGMALAIHGVGGGIGDVAGPMFTGFLLVFLSWRHILLWYALIPLIVAVAAVWAFRNIGWMEPSQPSPASRRWRITRQVLANRVLWRLAVVYALRAMALVALLGTLPLYLNDEMAMSPWSRGLHVGLLIAAGLIAKPAAGYVSDRIGRKSVLVAGLAWSAVMAWSLTVLGTGGAFTMAVGLLGLFLYPDQPVLTAAVFDLVGSEVAGTALGMVSFAAAVPATMSPLLAAVLYERVGFQAASWYAAALLALACVLLLATSLSSRTQR